MYHSVSDSFESDLSVTVRQFEQQMVYLSENFNVISLEKAVEYIKNGDIPEKNSIVITFDDGYKDNYCNAYPILKKLKLPATIFLLVSYIGTSSKWPPGKERGGR